MGLKVVVDSIDAVDEKYRDLYVKGDDGKFRLDAEIEDVSGLKTALQKERDTSKAALKRVSEFETRFAGIDPDQVRAILDRVANDEEAKLIAEGKIDQVIEKRTERLRADADKRVSEANDAAKAAADRANRFSQRVLDDQIRAAASKAGIHAHAVDDALFRGRHMFSLDENGHAVQLGDDGQPVLGKDGKTPFSPAEWLDSMKESAPHWFPAGSSGSGSGGGKRDGKNVNLERSTMTPAEKADYISKHGREQFMSLPWSVAKK
ncbi:hypothetical protein [Burkholderia vietnamiensis]|uniref:hypothetical protein n=1 Tax=Burkholderia vietnamiensis TaxID=60552 RepID=UPI001CF3B09D|nr:hypothetical protein [Burkholderia vietnamiensis]MCA7945575.1 hypothetical protein [Burkholderia vietnamiensis]